MGGIFHAKHVSHGHAFSPYCDAPDLSSHLCLAMSTATVELVVAMIGRQYRWWPTIIDQHAHSWCRKPDHSHPQHWIDVLHIASPASGRESLATVAQFL